MSKMSIYQAPVLKVLWGALVFASVVSAGAALHSQAANKPASKSKTPPRKAQPIRVPRQKAPIRGKLPARSGAMPGQSTLTGRLLPPLSPNRPPAVPREFRAAWITTVWNKDWPSRVGLSAAQQQAEAILILDRAQQLNLNALLFQARPMGDALFASSTEPWSQFLMGSVGANPGYDPLQFWIDEAHKRGMELHAWINPYRVGSVANRNYPANHISRRNPKYVVPYAKTLWLNPGQPGVNSYVRGVIDDVVKRYDIDGVHFDDYYYPYPEKDAAGQAMPFPDASSYQTYRSRGGRLALADWRRQNVNQMVQGVASDIKKRKPWVKFGISPFGIWRPGYPPSVRGLDPYNAMYADSRKWLQQGWVDYLTPQLYWTISAPQQSYPVLLKWWNNQNIKGRHLWPGHAASRIGNPGYTATEITNQINITRAQSTRSTGSVLFGWLNVMQNKGGIAGALQNTWNTPALVPASPWLGSGAPPAPRLQSTFDGQSGALRLTWQPADKNQAAWWVLQTRTNGIWNTQILPGAQSETSLFSAAGYWPQQVTLSVVNRVGNVSAPVSIGFGG
jgi:uncharacterized lipoprotein YddW (UPF0748 family)